MFKIDRFENKNSALYEFLPMSEFRRLVIGVMFTSILLFIYSLLEIMTII